MKIEYRLFDSFAESQSSILSDVYCHEISLINSFYLRDAFIRRIESIFDSKVNSFFTSEWCIAENLKQQKEFISLFVDSNKEKFLFPSYLHSWSNVLSQFLDARLSKGKEYIVVKFSESENEIFIHPKKTIERYRTNWINDLSNDCFALFIKFMSRNYLDISLEETI